MNSNRKRTSVNLYILLLNLLVSFFLSCGGCENSFESEKKPNPLLESEDVQKALIIQEAVREIYREVSPSVVRIETEQHVPVSTNPLLRRFFGTPDGTQKRQGLGSGFIFGEGGHVVTNYHVVAKVDRIKVKLLNGYSYEAKVIGYHKSSDIALLKIEPETKTKPIHIGDSKKVSVGDLVYAIGNPFGFSATLTSGVISSANQEEVETTDGIPRIQTDAAINPGNSGGPLLNIHGQVIGINQMIYTDKGGSVGIGFAIPINYAMTIIQKLKEGKKISSPYIGVQIFTNPPQSEIYRLGLKDKAGLLVEDVVTNSPAWKAGLRTFDFITHVDGKEAENFFDLKSRVAQKGIGKKLSLRFIRNQKNRTVSVWISKAPTDK